MLRLAKIVIIPAIGKSTNNNANEMCGIFKTVPNKIEAKRITVKSIKKQISLNFIFRSFIFYSPPDVC